MRARQYDPRLGRFTQTDPIVRNRSTEQYAYAGSNPVSVTDPSGLEPPDEENTLGPRPRFDPELARKQLLETGNRPGAETTTADPGTKTPAPETPGSGTTTVDPGQTKAERIGAAWVKNSPYRTQVVQTSAGTVWVKDSEGFAWFKEIVPWLYAAALAKVVPAFAEMPVKPGGPRLDPALRELPLQQGAGAAHADEFYKVTSNIDRVPGLVRHAEAAGSRVQRSFDALTEQLSKGNLEPGLGTKNLQGNIFYARSRDGARVFFIRRPGSIEIIGKADKANEDAVIRLIQKNYAESSK
jgi:hypothetical protein